MGHEMGHYVLGHVVRSILLSSIVILAGLFMVDRLGRSLVDRFRSRLGFADLADIASVPLMMLLLEVAFLVLSPVGLAYSRHQEHEADKFALKLTRANHSAGISFVKLQGGESEQSPPRSDLPDLSSEPPQHWRAYRLLQLVSSVAHRRTKVGSPGGGVIPQSVGGGNQAF